MNTEKAHCTLCGLDVPESDLHAHQSEETREIVEYTISMIKSRHPEWTQHDPACQKVLGLLPQPLIA